MKQILSKSLMLISAALLIGFISPGCKSKVKDADVEAAAKAALASNDDLKGLSVNVKDGIATIAGEVKDESEKAAAETAVKSVNGVKSVQNNVTIAAATAPVEIAGDDALTKGVRDATKDYPTVKATVNDGVIFVSGELKSDQWRKLKEALDGLKPKRVDASGLKINN
jgi:osmotically-inducible protein OsmY